MDLNLVQGGVVRGKKPKVVVSISQGIAWLERPMCESVPDMGAQTKGFKKRAGAHPPKRK